MEISEGLDILARDVGVASHGVATWDRRCTQNKGNLDLRKDHRCKSRELAKQDGEIHNEWIAGDRQTN